MKKTVWKFTNKKQLTASQFVDYFERKIWRTIRKYGMLPKDKKIKLKKTSLVNTAVLKHVLEKKFPVSFSDKPNMCYENLSHVSENVFENLLKGKFQGKKPKDAIACPLYFLLDEEIELYAKLAGIKGKKRKRDEKIRRLFSRFEKNPDLEHNVVKGLSQLDC